MRRRDFLLGSAALGASTALRAQDAGAFQEVTREQLDAIDRGLTWLGKNQYSSGAIGSTCQTAFTGLAGLAFLANNSTPYRGKYAKQARSIGSLGHHPYRPRCGARSVRPAHPAPQQNAMPAVSRQRWRHLCGRILLTNAAKMPKLRPRRPKTTAR